MANFLIIAFIFLTVYFPSIFVGNVGATTTSEGCRWLSSVRPLITWGHHPKSIRSFPKADFRCNSAIQNYGVKTTAHRRLIQSSL